MVATCSSRLSFVFPRGFSALEDGMLLRTAWESVISVGPLVWAEEVFDWTGIIGGRSSEAVIGWLD